MMPTTRINKYINIIQGIENGRQYTTLGEYEVMATDIQHAAFVMNRCKVEHVDIGVLIETIEAPKLNTDEIDSLLN